MLNLIDATDDVTTDIGDFNIDLGGVLGFDANRDIEGQLINNGLVNIATDRTLRLIDDSSTGVSDSGIFNIGSRAILDLAGSRQNSGDFSGDDDAGLRITAGDVDINGDFSFAGILEVGADNSVVNVNISQEVDLDSVFVTGFGGDANLNLQGQGVSAGPSQNRVRGSIIISSSLTDSATLNSGTDLVIDRNIALGSGSNLVSSGNIEASELNLSLIHI